MKKYTCFHFSKNDDCLGYRDGRKIVLGETLSVDVKPRLCGSGLHGSESVVDALGYASGSHLWLVEIWGDVDNGNDKLCGKHRKAIIQYGDILPIIVEFAKWCANRAAKYAAESAAESAAEYAKYAAESAKYAAESAAEYAKYAKYAAEYAAESAKYAAKYAAEYAAKKEQEAQRNWWSEKLQQLKG